MSLYCQQFAAKYASEIVKIGQCLIKLGQKLSGLLSWTAIYMDNMGGLRSQI